MSTKLICRPVLLLSPCLFLGLTAGCEKASATATEQPVPKVTTTAVIQQETTDYDEYTGRTEASEIGRYSRTGFRLFEID